MWNPRIGSPIPDIPSHPRFGSIFAEHWHGPLSRFRFFGGAGKIPAINWLCIAYLLMRWPTLWLEARRNITTLPMHHMMDILVSFHLGILEIWIPRPEVND